MSFNEYDNYDALGLAELIKKGEVTPADLLDEAISRAEKLNPKLNAITLKMYDIARASLNNIPEGPFHGVPFLIKDLLGHFEGVPTSSGTEALKNIPATYDAELVKRYKNSGLITLGKTSCPELGLMGVTEPKAFGPARNPWNIDKTPGGSSGGAASVVAAGIVPLASGGDGGGSIRIPSACCGLFGLKPSRGRVPLGPDAGEVWEGAVQEHVLTKTVRDSAAMLDCIHGPDATSPYRIQTPQQSFLSSIERPPRKLKIGFTSLSPVGTPVSPEYKSYVEKAATQLQNLGHEVEECAPVFDATLLKTSYMTMYMGQVAVDLHDMSKKLKIPVSDLAVEKTTKILGLLGHSISAFEYAKAKRDWHLFMTSMANYFSKFDLLMTPTLGCPPVDIASLEPTKIEQIGMDIVYALKAGKLLAKTGIVDELAEKSLSKFPFTFIANLTGLPAMSVPLFWDKQNLPVGIHFIGQMCDEALLFQLARQLEMNNDWFNKRPSL